MKAMFTAIALTALAVSPSAFAQTSSSKQPAPSTTENSNSNQNGAVAQKIRQDLTNAGFTDVKVVAESFVVQAKSKDGDPVLMTIGPHGMSVFEAMNASGTNSNSNTTGSNTSPSSSTGASSTGASHK